MIRYIHGSADSIDLDTVYVFEEMPSFQQCQQFCRSEDIENRNIIVIRDGIVADCFKGLADEVNNAIYTTYPLHVQKYPLLIERMVPRDVFLKDIVASRKLLSALTRTNFRTDVKAALRGSWQSRLSLLCRLDLSEVRFAQTGEGLSREHGKMFAFQLGQAVALHRGKELYTKADVAAVFPDLRPYLYREDAPLGKLQAVLADYCGILQAEPTVDLPDGCVRIASSGRIYDIHRELQLPCEQPSRDRILR